MDPALVNTKILPHLPIESVISLAATLRYNGEKSEDMWQQRLTKMGYPVVPFPQGFYFILKSNSNPAMQFRGLVCNRIDVHVEAFLYYHSKKSGKTITEVVKSFVTDEFCLGLTPDDVTPHVRELLKEALYKEHIDTYHAMVADGRATEARRQLEYMFFEELDYRASMQICCELTNDIKAELVSVPTIIITLSSTSDYDVSFVLGEFLRYFNYPAPDVWLGSMRHVLKSGYDVWKDPNAGWRQYDEVMDDNPIYIAYIEEITALTEEDFRYYPSLLYALTRDGDIPSVIASLEKYSTQIKENLPALRLLLEDAVRYDSGDTVKSKLAELSIM